ncbi:molybdate ABC transporter substrate-binding protein [Saccharopolyspora gloriosae]|uniref:Molybdate transport system substrate-binding protein n=1 Tax=Saccharopolyspora gloriosae TaxID=455344 RepID=A0A840NS83_9PSEU|nr:molybdate transport system substrate-binding protein [Saccharopolyspora gloriosae]
MVKPRVVAAFAGFVLLLAGCSTGGTGQAQGERTVTVLAAASLTESFDELAGRFEAENPGVKVQLDYAGSSTLVEQLAQGRRADVFASADTKNMDKATGAGVTGAEPQVFATNKLTIAVPKGNPDHIASLADLNAPGRLVVQCAPQVPCGSAARTVEQAAGLRINAASEENDVKSVLRKVTAGEADAGLVYVTDAKAAADQVQGVDFPEAQRAINDYPIVSLKDAPEPELGAKFLDYVRGPVGAEVLTAHGFGTE